MTGAGVLVSRFFGLLTPFFEGAGAALGAGAEAGLGGLGSLGGTERPRLLADLGAERAEETSRFVRSVDAARRWTDPLMPSAKRCHILQRRFCG